MHSAVVVANRRRARRRMSDLPLSAIEHVANHLDSSSTRALARSGIAGHGTAAPLRAAYAAHRAAETPAERRAAYEASLQRALETAFTNTALRAQMLGLGRRSDTDPVWYEPKLSRAKYIVAGYPSPYYTYFKVTRDEGEVEGPSVANIDWDMDPRAPTVVRLAGGPELHVRSLRLILHPPTNENDARVQRALHRAVEAVLGRRVQPEPPV
jgi:hypothetical protein